MRLYSLGEIEWKQTQLFYHAMGQLGVEGVVICRSSSPYFCVGFHQDLRKELDVEHLDEIGVPYFRRETGGGTVRLDTDQVYYQVVIHRDNPEAPARPDHFCERYLHPAVDALKALGLKGQMVPPNDILVDDRKISGNGGGQLGDCKVLVGDLLVGYDTEPMCRGLRMPSEWFRDKVMDSMSRNIITVRDKRPDIGVEEVEAALTEAFMTICREGEATSMPRAVLDKARELGESMLSPKWLFHPGPRRPGRRVKVREGVQLGAIEIEDEGWLSFEVEEGRLKHAWVRGADRTDVLRTKLGTEGPFLKDLRRMILDMGLPKDMAEGVLVQMRDRLGCQAP